MTTPPTSALIDVKDLRVSFMRNGRSVRAVDSVSFGLEEGETLGIVGESGSGKTVTALALIGLVSNPPAQEIGGSIVYRGLDLRTLTDRQWRRIRGKEIGMIFQDPTLSLNPVYTVGDQVAEAILIHNDCTREEARGLTLDWLEKVGLFGEISGESAGEILGGDGIFDLYPHQLSGGMKQRVMIAMALAPGPRLLIADEPTTALDASIRLQILRLLRDLAAAANHSMLIISHNFSEVRELANRVAVMYAGSIVETGSLEDVLERSRHPYTVGLLRSVPKLTEKNKRLVPIPGQPPVIGNTPPGCAFHPRCAHSMAVCQFRKPGLIHTESQTHLSRCYLNDPTYYKDKWPQ